MTQPVRVCGIMKCHFEMAAAATAATAAAAAAETATATCPAQLPVSSFSSLLLLLLFVYCLWLSLLLSRCPGTLEMYLRATPFIKTLNARYMACVIVIKMYLLLPQTCRYTDTIPSMPRRRRDVRRSTCCCCRLWLTALPVLSLLLRCLSMCK